MVGYQELGRQVSGSQGTPVNTSMDGSIETNNYDEGLEFEETGGAYPYTIDPAFQGEYINLTDSGDIIMEVHTISGDVVSIPLKGATGDIPVFSHDKLVFKDPNGTGTSIAGFIAGES